MGRKRLAFALAITGVFLVAEVVGALVSGSLALLADAGHMLTDVGALGLALFASRLATRPPTSRRTFGLLRAEVLGAFVNGGSLVLIVGLILWEAYHRLSSPPTIYTPVMLAIGVLGLAANLWCARVLMASRHDNINIRGAFLHVVGDAMGSVAVIFAAIGIHLTGWMIIDPLVSAGIAAIILLGTYALLRDSLGILINATPVGLDFEKIKHAMESNEHVELVHDLHIWLISSGIPILTAHVRLHPQCSDTSHWQQCLLQMQDMLSHRFGIVHSTLQFEPSGYRQDARLV